MAKYTKYLGYNEALKKLQHYCAYQDRCHYEVRGKLLELKIYGEELERIITELIQDNFLNEERFAKSFVRGKHRIKKWGRSKITAHLKMKKISAYCIKKGLEEIDEEEYIQTLIELLEKRLKKDASFQEVGKIATYLRNKGYENSLIWENIKMLQSSSQS